MTEAEARKIFSPTKLSLCLKRNITSLADPNQHRAKLDYGLDKVNLTFSDWSDDAVIAISPTADIILFANHTPDKLIFLAKLRKEPINQYVARALEVALDYDEQVTSLLCLPCMSTQRTAYGLVDWTALVVGLSSGYIKFYTEQSICLMSLKFFADPIRAIKCQTQKINLNARSELHFPSLTDELLISHGSSFVIIDGMSLYENLRIARDEVVKNGSNYEPAYSLTNLPTVLNCQKWTATLPAEATVSDAEIFGSRSKPIFDSMRSGSTDYDYIPTKVFSKTIVAVGKNPFLSCHHEAKESTSHSYTEMIGSLLNIWSKPQPSKVQADDISSANNLSMFDKGRHATSIVASPDKRLAAVTDDYGRVLMVDITNWIVVRMWKGYRSAQCGWIEVKRKPSQRDSPYATFLVIYAPKRGLLEIWSAQRGPRVAAFDVGKSCRLLYSGYKMLNTRVDAQQKKSLIGAITEESYSSHCYLLNTKSETVFSVEIPYTYSLYKYGDLKSRDHLILGELSNAIKLDSEVDSISEIVHRLALAESIECAIKKIIENFLPEKIVPVLENLTMKVMRNYDNHAGERISDEDTSILELCKRVLRLCAIYRDLSSYGPRELMLPDVNQRLIDEYEEHPHEIDDFAHSLGWSASEILRYLSLLALDRSYRKCHLSNPWPSIGEPLGWTEFIGCFNTDRLKIRPNKDGAEKQEAFQAGRVSIKLLDLSSKFLNEDRVVKSAIFMYNRLSENFYRSIAQPTRQCSTGESELISNHSYIEPCSRLALLFQFWLSTKLCNHWRMWAFLQDQIWKISDELKVSAPNQEKIRDDRILVDLWKQIYNLILESDNIFGAITATAGIRSDTLRLIKADGQKDTPDEENDDQQAKLEHPLIEEQRETSDWECLCIDAERMSILGQQLEDVFLLDMLLRYSVSDGHLVDRYIYRTPRISVAAILRGGPTIVSELVAQWAIQSKIDPTIFLKPYLGGSEPLVENENEQARMIVMSSQTRRGLAASVRSAHSTNLDHAKELLHHTKTAFPCSLEANVVLINCVWELCRRWANNSSTLTDKSQLLKRALETIRLIEGVELRHRLAAVAYKTFFQHTFVRLVILVETNSTMINVKNSRLCDSLTRKELNMSEDCLEDFVEFTCQLSEFMLETRSEVTSDKVAESSLMQLDNWWSTPAATNTLDDMQTRAGSQRATTTSAGSTTHLVKTIVCTSNLLDVTSLVELNRLASLMKLILKLAIARAYPMSLIGEDSRQILQLDLQQSPSSSLGFTPADLKSRSNSASLPDLRHKFARKCIQSIVRKIDEHSDAFGHCDAELDEAIDDRSSDAWRARSLNSQPDPVGSHNESSRPAAMSNAGKLEQTNKGTSEDNVDAHVGAISHSSCRWPVIDGGAYDDDTNQDATDMENNESMLLFANLLSIAVEWEIDCDELYLEFAFELYRCNHDKTAAQIVGRIRDQQLLANGLLKISSQRVLVLFGLSPQVSGPEWRRRTDRWSSFPPNVVSWLRSVQQEEMKREIASLSFGQSHLPEVSEQSSDRDKLSASTCLPVFVLETLRHRTKLVLESATNHLQGQAARLAYDLLSVLSEYRID